jgi:hypothetical protein
MVILFCHRPVSHVLLLDVPSKLYAIYENVVMLVAVPLSCFPDSAQLA